MMNIDELKNIWEHDKAESTPEVSTEQRNQLHLPLEKIRKNMRWEFWSNLLMFLVILIVIWNFDLSFRFRLYLEILVGAMMLVTSFFYTKFFKLYQEINQPELGTLSSLRQLLHQFYLNKQYYLSLYISFVPFIVTELIIIMEFSTYSRNFSDFRFGVFFLSSVGFALFFLWIVAKLWFQYYYGKYIKAVETLVAELEG